MVKHLNMEGIKELGGAKYKTPINVEESTDSYILLDLLIFLPMTSYQQATFPWTLKMPLQIELVVHLHDHFASKYLVDTLYQLGFCKSYKVQL